MKYGILASSIVKSSLYGDPHFASVVALLRFDGTNGSTSLPDLIAGNTWSFGGTAAISTTQSRFGGASGVFNGLGTLSRATCADKVAFEMGSGDFTGECWVRQSDSASPGIQTVFSKRADTAAYASYALFLDAGKPRLVCSSNGSSYFIDSTAAAALSLGNWHHLALVRYGNSFKVYADGVAVITATSSSALHDNAGTLNVGGEVIGGGTDRSFNGYIDGFRLTKGVARYLADFTPVPYMFPSRVGVPQYDPYFSYVKARLAFDGTSGSTSFPDSTGRSWSVNGGLNVSNTVSKYSGSGQFDGTTDFLTASSSADFDIFAAEFIVEGWVRFPATTGNHCFFEIGSSLANRANVSLVSGNLVFYTETGAGGATRISSAAPAVDTFHHVALVKVGTTFTLYVNGVSVGTSTTAIYPTGNMQCRIGGNLFASGNDWNGYIDDFRLTKGFARVYGNFTPSGPHPLSNS